MHTVEKTPHTTIQFFKPTTTLRRKRKRQWKISIVFFFLLLYWYSMTGTAITSHSKNTMNKYRLEYRYNNRLNREKKQFAVDTEKLVWNNSKLHLICFIQIRSAQWCIQQNTNLLEKIHVFEILPFFFQLAAWQCCVLMNLTSNKRNFGSFSDYFQ